jgi:fibronectin type 3 domain-containing protein
MNGKETLILSVCAFAVVAGTCFFCCAQATKAARDPRIGWEESFDTIDRWKAALMKPAGTPMKSVEGADGTISIVTPCGALDPSMKKPNWPEWPKEPATSFSNFTVNYDDVVDFDTFHYLVVRIVEKNTFFILFVNGKPTRVCYTTGIHSQDLRTLGLTGKQKVALWGQFLNTSGGVKIDYIRLVSDVTPEEKKGFIDEGLTVRAENFSAHPYHGLEALNARAGRPIKKDPLGGEWCVYRDTGTGAEIWKMTAGATDEFGPTFNCDGSAFTVKGRGPSGFHVFDWTTRTFRFVEGGLNDAAPRFSTTEPDAMIVAENTWIKTDPPRQRRITLWRVNFRTGERTEIAHFEPKTWIVQELHSSSDSSKMVFGLRESPNVFLIDPSIPDLDKRVRPITLPTRLKGISLINNDAELRWYNCYTYESWMMDLATGKVSLGNGCTAGGHAAGGPHWTIGPYSSLMKILVKNGLHPQTEATAGDVRIFANYAKPVVTDYGCISPDGKWMVTDGVTGDVAGQHLLISIADPAAVLRACFHHTSRNDWVTNTYSTPSPDATKVAWVCDQFDIGDIYMAITGRPAAPTELKAERIGNGVKLAWKAPEGARESAGYRVYRSTGTLGNITAISKALTRDTQFVDADAPAGAVAYCVAAVEPSGLEGLLSNQAFVDAGPNTPVTVALEAQCGEWKAPLRQVLNGDALTSRYIRVHHASQQEPASGALRFKLDVPPANYSVFVRGRAEGESGAWEYWVEPATAKEVNAARPVGSAMFNKQADKKAAFEIVKGGAVIDLTKAKGPQVLVLSSSTDGLAIDRVILTSAAAVAASYPTTVRPAAVQGLETFDVTPQSVKLRWKANPELNIARCDIHAGGTDDAGSLGNATIIGSTTGTEFEDWGLRPGTKMTYRVVAVDSRGMRSQRAKVEVTTAPEPIQVLSADSDVKVDGGKFSFPINVESDAPFMLWAKYRPGYASSFAVTVEIDGKPAGKWTLRAPYRPMATALVAANVWAHPVWTDKVIADGKDVFRLEKGKHTVTFVLDPKVTGEQHTFMKVYASNDHSWRPEGYNPRANFTKRQPAE